MNIRIISRPEFCICGYTVKTTLENNDTDIGKLYEDFFSTGKESRLLGLPGCKNGFYGLEWYTPDHKSFYYLLGKEVDRPESVPDGAVLKAIPAAQYAIGDVASGISLVDAWTQFFYTDIPARGFKPDENHGFYFEYYPDITDGRCELWVPVLKSSVF